MSDLSHCPFCGGEARVFESNHFATHGVNGTSLGLRAPHFRITCLSCKSFGPSEIDRDTAIARWNTRKLWPVGAPSDGISEGLG